MIIWWFRLIFFFVCFFLFFVCVFFGGWDLDVYCLGSRRHCLPPLRGTHLTLQPGFRGGCEFRLPILWYPPRFVFAFWPFLLLLPLLLGWPGAGWPRPVAPLLTLSWPGPRDSKKCNYCFGSRSVSDPDPFRIQIRFIGSRSVSLDPDPFHFNLPDQGIK